MAVDLFAVIPVRHHASALDFYVRLLGSPPSFEAHATESVWEVTEHGWIAVAQEPEHAGHARVTVFVEDLDERVSAIAQRGIEPHRRETYPNGVRKVTYRDPDGSEIGFGGAPADEDRS